MSRIPCKKCPQCGLYNDFTVEKCECEKTLNSIGAQFVNTDELSPEEYGEIDTSLKVYVQKCSACGALNFTDDPSNPVKVCYNCHKTRIAAIVPVEYVEEDSEDDKKNVTPETEVKIGFDVQPTADHIAQDHSSYAGSEDEDDNDDDDDSAQWQSILGNIQRAVGSTPAAKTCQAYTQQVVEPKTIQVPNSLDNDDDDDDDDDEVGDWSDILGTTAKTTSTTTPKRQAHPTPAKKDITLTAIRYGRLTFTVEAAQGTYMLGRSANQGAFLSQDGRVGNEHCYLFFRNGTWFVRDNNSKNGTAVNSRDIGLNGECILSDGDELKLGHHPDSVAFRISIK